MYREKDQQILKWNERIMFKKNILYMKRDFQETDTDSVKLLSTSCECPVIDDDWLDSCKCDIWLL